MSATSRGPSSSNGNEKLRTQNIQLKNTVKALESKVNNLRQTQTAQWKELYEAQQRLMIYEPDTQARETYSNELTRANERIMILEIELDEARRTAEANAAAASKGKGKATEGDFYELQVEKLREERDQARRIAEELRNEGEETVEALEGAHIKEMEEKNTLIEQLKAKLVSLELAQAETEKQDRVLPVAQPIADSAPATELAAAKAKIARLSFQLQALEAQYDALYAEKQKVSSKLHEVYQGFKKYKQAIIDSTPTKSRSVDKLSTRKKKSRRKLRECFEGFKVEFEEANDGTVTEAAEAEVEVDEDEEPGTPSQRKLRQPMTPTSKSQVLPPLHLEPLAPRLVERPVDQSTDTSATPPLNEAIPLHTGSPQQGPKHSAIATLRPERVSAPGPTSDSHDKSGPSTDVPPILVRTALPTPRTIPRQPPPPPVRVKVEWSSPPRPSSQNSAQPSSPIPSRAILRVQQPNAATPESRAILRSRLDLSKVATPTSAPSRLGKSKATNSLLDSPSTARSVKQESPNVLERLSSQRSQSTPPGTPHRLKKSSHGVLGKRKITALDLDIPLGTNNATASSSKQRVVTPGEGRTLKKLINREQIEYSAYKGKGRYHRSVAEPDDRNINELFEIDSSRNEGMDQPFDAVVRERRARRQLDAGDCEECRDYYEAVGPLPPRMQGPMWRSPSASRSSQHTPPRRRCQHHETMSPSPRSVRRLKAIESHKKDISRHRHRWAPAEEPPNYWQIGFPDTQEVEEINRRAEEMDRRKLRRVEVEASKKDGIYRRKR